MHRYRCRAYFRGGGGGEGVQTQDKCMKCSTLGDALAGEVQHRRVYSTGMGQSRGLDSRIISLIQEKHIQNISIGIF